MQITVRQLRAIIRESIVDRDFRQMDEGFKDKAKKFMKIIPLFTIALAAQGCKPGRADNCDVFRTNGFTEDEIVVVQDAIDEICEKTKGIHCATLGDEGDSTLDVVAQVSCPGNTASPGHVFGGCNTQNPDTEISHITVRADRENPEWLTNLHKKVRHELLHHLRGDKTHLPAGNALAPSIEQQGQYVTDLDVQGI